MEPEIIDNVIYAHHYGAFYENPSFWVAVSFVLVVAFLYRPISKVFVALMQKRIDGILNRITEASSLKDDAQKLLAEYETRHKNAQKEAKNILKKAQKEVQLLETETLAKLENQLKIKEKEAKARINNSANNAGREIKEQIATKTSQLVENLIKTKLKKSEQNKLIDDIIAKM